jgi:hypothetical protein
MGQARRRGTFEERKAAAILRDENKPREETSKKEIDRTVLHLRHRGFISKQG